MTLIIGVCTCLYYYNVVSPFSPWGDFADMAHALIILIVAWISIFILICLSFFKDKYAVYICIIVLLILSFIGSFPTFNDDVKLAKHDKQKELFKLQEWLEWYNNFSEKYNSYLKKYWDDFDEEFIFYWVKKDLLFELEKWFKKQADIYHLQDGNNFNKVDIELNTSQVNHKYILLRWSKNRGSVVTKIPIKKSREGLEERFIILQDRLEILKKEWIKEKPRKVITYDYNIDPQEWKEESWVITTNIQVNNNSFLLRIYSSSLYLSMEHSIDFKTYVNDDQSRRDYFENLQIIYSLFESWNLNINEKIWQPDFRNN